MPPLSNSLKSGAGPDRRGAIVHTISIQNMRVDRGQSENAEGQGCGGLLCKSNLQRVNK